MSVTKNFKLFVLDQLAELGNVSSRAMFGGVGLYQHEWFFGILWDDKLFLKVDDKSRPSYEAEGMEVFRPYANKPLTMSYYAVPLHVLEHARALTDWARVAVQAARDSEKHPRRRRRT